MNRFDVPGRLEWRANSVTCLAAPDVTVAIAERDGGGWDASGIAADPQDGEHPGSFREFDPAFALRFADGGAVEVVVEQDAGEAAFTLTEPVITECGIHAART